jgi:hypothetical protein
MIDHIVVNKSLIFFIAAKFSACCSLLPVDCLLKIADRQANSCNALPASQLNSVSKTGKSGQILYLMIKNECGMVK